MLKDVKFDHFGFRYDKKKDRFTFYFTEYAEDKSSPYMREKDFEFDSLYPQFFEDTIKRMEENDCINILRAIENMEQEINQIKRRVQMKVIEEF